MTDERRLHSRIAFHTQAKLVVVGKSLEAVVLDLSLKGALIRLSKDAKLEEGSICLLHVYLNEIELVDQISMEVRVAHTLGRNVGLLSVSIDIDSVIHLRRLVELNLGDQELLERELSALLAE